MISIIVPTLNEEAFIAETLVRAREALPYAQILVVDGGSDDSTVLRSSPLAQVIHGERGRGRQLSLGAQHAHGDILLFLHADTLLPHCDVTGEIEERMSDPSVIGGNFQVEFAPSDSRIRLLEAAYRLVRRANIFFGDSAIFVRKGPFLDRGPVQQGALMEDVELVRWMRGAGRIVQVPYPIITSSRRFRGKVGRQLAKWALIHVLYSCGVREDVLGKLYPAVR